MASLTRGRKPVWIDPRLWIGLLLVAGSVGGVVALVSSFDSTIEVYASRVALVPGHQLELADLRVERVALATVEAGYLLVEGTDAESLVVTRTVGAGELIPLSAIGDTASQRFASVVVPVQGGIAEAIQAGAAVDVWAAAEMESGAFGPPVVLVPAATIVRLVETEGFMTAGQTREVEILIPRAKTARMLEAIVNGEALSLVPAAPAGRG